MKYYVGLIAMLVVNTMQGANRSDFVEKFDPTGWYASISVTSTNLVLEFRPDMPRVPIRLFPQRRSRRSDPNEKLVLFPDQKTSLAFGRHGSTVFIPVAFKNQHKGFQILKIADLRSVGRDITTNAMYVALSDTPMDVGEEDVESIMEWVRGEDRNWHGEWKPYVPSQPIIEKDDNATLEEIPSVIKIEVTPSVVTTSTHDDLPPVTVTETKPTNLWLYLGIGAILGVCAIVWIAYKKRKAT